MKNCLISNRSYNSILLECSPGQENGLQQTFYLQVYEKARDVYEDDHDEVIPSQEENEEEILIAEMRNQHYPYFTVDNLKPDSDLRFVVFSTNQKVGFFVVFLGSMS